MKKAIIVMILSAISLSGCADNNFPRVTIDTAFKSNYIHIDIGKPYVYKGFDTGNTDNGMDLILHFEEGNP